MFRERLAAGSPGEYSEQLSPEVRRTVEEGDRFTPHTANLHGIGSRTGGHRLLNVGSE
jgi:hypothetical protein